MKPLIPNFFQNKKIIAGLLLLVTLAAYWRVRTNEFVGHDDYIYVVDNSHIKEGFNLETLRWAFQTTMVANWHPITWVSHALDVSFFGLKPGGHHLTSLAIHLLNVLLLFILLIMMTGEVGASGCVAALFALHPLSVDSVAWIAERKNLLCLFFGLLSLICYVRHVRQSSRLLYGASLFCFALALMAKPMLVTLPFLMLLLDFWPLGRFDSVINQAASSPQTEEIPGKNLELASQKKRRAKRKEKRGAKANSVEAATFCPQQNSVFSALTANALALRSIILEKLPFFLIALISCVVTVYVQNLGGAVKAMAQLGIRVRLENAVVAYVAYLRKLFWPVSLAVFYPHPGDTLPKWKVIWAFLLLASITAAAVFFIRKLSWLTVGWFWFLGSLVPVIGIVQVGDQAMADRYAYLPMIGIFVALVWGIIWIIGRFPACQTSAVVLFLAVCVLLAFQTHRQLSFWKDSHSLFAHALEVTQGNYVALTGLGKDAFEKGQNEVAISYFRRALDLNPKYSYARDNLAGTIHNQGVQKALQGFNSEAISFYQQALQIAPETAEFHYNLGLAYYALNRKTEATAEFEQTIRYNPSHFSAYRALGALLAEKGKPSEALDAYQRSLDIQPDAETYFQIGALLNNQGNLRDGIRYFKMALALNPHHSQALQALQMLMKSPSF